MRIALYTLTRDRLEYTQKCFQTLWDKSGVPFDHYVLDNGSQDGTPKWLTDNSDKFKWIQRMPENVGISKGSNICLDAIFLNDYDLVIKIDNDCEIVSENILGQIVEIYSSMGEFSPKYVLSPRVEGINRQPTRGRYDQIGGRNIGLTAIVGGLFHVVPAELYKKYRYPIHLPKAHGQDDTFCKWVKDNGGQVGYVEDLIVNHFETTNGQAQRFPSYFERKWKEEKL